MKNKYSIDLGKNIYRIIEQYINITNLDNFLFNNENIIYKCSICKSKIDNCTKKNKILYKKKNINNNLLDECKEELKLNEFYILNKIDYRNIKYKLCPDIICNFCKYINDCRIKNMNNSLKFDILPEYITYDIYNIFKFNNFYFNNDKIYKYHSFKINRINIYNKNNILYINYIFIDNFLDIKFSTLNMILYKKVNKIIKNDFDFNLDYLKIYIKNKND